MNMRPADSCTSMSLSWYPLGVCGRYTVANPRKILAEVLGSDDCPELVARYNVAPTQLAPVVLTREDGSRHLVKMQWGLVPNWVNTPNIEHHLINARSETAWEKPAFRDSLKQRRCVIAADGFYEWQKTQDVKNAYLLRLTGGTPFGFAGLWDRWNGSHGNVLNTFAILTTHANALVEPLHDRMPVILDHQQRDAWLSPRTDPHSLRLLCEPCPGAAMEAFPVSNYVNNTAHDSVECLQPAQRPMPRTLF